MYGYAYIYIYAYIVYIGLSIIILGRSSQSTLMSDIVINDDAKLSPFKDCKSFWNKFYLYIYIYINEDAIFLKALLC